MRDAPPWSAVAPFGPVKRQHLSNCRSDRVTALKNLAVQARCAPLLPTILHAQYLGAARTSPRPAACPKRRVPGWLHRVDRFPRQVFHLELLQRAGDLRRQSKPLEPRQSPLGQVTTPLTSPPPEPPQAVDKIKRTHYLQVHCHKAKSVLQSWYPQVQLC